MSLPHARLTPREYLEGERKSERRHEYIDGCVYAMAGATEAHDLITGNVHGLMWSQFRGRPCRFYTQDMRVKVNSTGLYTYPDASALCGEPLFEDEQRDTLLNPSLIVEVLSPSTEAYDRGKKFAHYRRVDSLTDFVLIAQDAIRVEHFHRQSDGSWVLVEMNRLEETLTVASIACEFPLAEIFDRVVLAAGI